MLATTESPRRLVRSKSFNVSERKHNSRLSPKSSRQRVTVEKRGVDFLWEKNRTVFPSGNFSDEEGETKALDGLRKTPKSKTLQVLEDNSLQVEVKDITSRPLKKQNSILRKSIDKFRNINSPPSLHTQGDKSLTLLTSCEPTFDESYQIFKEKHKKLLKKHSKLKKKVQNLKEKEKEIADSCSRLQRKTSSPSITRRKKLKEVKYLRVNPREIQLRERLGSGGSGAVVYSCVVDGWVCAMKQLTSENKLEMESFEKEMNILYNLPQHPNIIKYLFHSSINGKMCLFMTQHNTTLQRYIQKKQASKTLISESEVRWITSNIIKGIEFLHGNNIIHRDIKPENIYCTATAGGQLNEVVIADFDTAKRAGVGNTPHSIIGTLGYMAPEVFNNLDTVGYSFSADIFSFGMVLYSLLSTQEPYFELSNPFQIYDKLQNGTLPSFSNEQLDKYSQELVELHRNCIRVDSTLRPHTSQIQSSLGLRLGNCIKSEHTG